MSLIKNYYKIFIKIDLINKFYYKNINKIPKIKKVVLTFNFNHSKIKELTSALLALKLITTKKGTFTISKKNNILLKIQKGNIIGCKLILHKSDMYLFLYKLLNNVIIKSNLYKNLFLYKTTVNLNSLSFSLKEILNFDELNNYFHLFYKLSALNITIVTNTKTRKELIYVLKSIKIPVILKANVTQIGRV